MLSFWVSLAVLPSLLNIALTLDPSTVPIATRDQWCQSQITECPLICLQTKGNTAGTEKNDCDPQTLTYDCICSNGISPNASQYSQTLPYYICTEENNQCVANCGLNNNECASNCRQDNPCGAQSPTRVNTSTISTMASTSTSGSSTATGDTVYTGFGSDGSSATATSTSSSNSGSAGARLVLNLGEFYGLTAVVAGIFAGFAFIL